MRTVSLVLSCVAFALAAFSVYFSVSASHMAECQYQRDLRRIVANVERSQGREYALIFASVVDKEGILSKDLRCLY